MKKKIVLFFNMVRPQKFLKIFSIIRKDGIAGVKYHFYLIKDRIKGLNKNCMKEYDISPVVEREFQETGKWEYGILDFQEYKEPIVSIMIPVYNQFAYTYHCLEHIKRYETDIPYEIIVGDDCSTDRTKELERVAKGIKVIHNETNRQYLDNCNQMGKEARGKYLILLNNDTQVQKDWMESLVSLMEKDETIGLAGSKMIYPNGLAQEAGGIVWRDGSILQFGNGRQPDEEELNTQREVDYISGASIIIRRELWNDIGGFDRQFAPAYYEDVDLAFQVRERGYKVVYQPESELIHFAGLTEGVNEETRNLIERNREKFYFKWEEVLENQHYDFSEYARLVKENPNFMCAGSSNMVWGEDES